MRLAPRLWIVALAAIGFGLTAQEAKAGFQSFSITTDQNGTVISPSYATVTVYDAATYNPLFGGPDAAAGSVVIKTDINTPPGDLFALYFNFAVNTQQALDALAITGLTSTIATTPDGAFLTGVVKSVDNVNQVSDPNSSINPVQAVFDIGVQFGGPGSSPPDTFVSTAIQISSTDLGVTGPLDFSKFVTPSQADTNLGPLFFGLRVQSTGTLGGGSLKLVTPVPAPPTLLLMAAGVPALALRRFIRRKKAEA